MVTKRNRLSSACTRGNKNVGKVIWFYGAISYKSQIIFSHHIVNVSMERNHKFNLNMLVGHT